MWFEDLTGFTEESAQQVRANLVLDGHTLTSRVNGRSAVCGRLETPSLAELRQALPKNATTSGRIRVREVIGDARSLHANPVNAGALFQVASQFNLLEMPSQHVTPERGVGAYEDDRTQGPACAVAAGAGTIYRSYFAEVNGRRGQSFDNQIDCLHDMGTALGNTDGRLWRMQNGYALATQPGLVEISGRIKAMSGAERDSLRQALRIGIQWDTQVTLSDCTHLVTQVYASALPVAYSQHAGYLWTEFAQLILEASYEATLCAALLNYARTGNSQVYLTLIGGGVFGNQDAWILAAIKRAIELFRQAPLDLAIVSHQASKPQLSELIALTHL